MDEVHDVRPALQGDDQEYRHPGQADVVKGDGSMEWVSWSSRTFGVVLHTGLSINRIFTEIVHLIPVDTSFLVSCLLHGEKTFLKMVKNYVKLSRSYFAINWTLHRTY